MNYFLAFLISFWSFNSQPSEGNPPTPCKNSQFLLGLSQQKYDDGQRWEQSELRVHIQEPRVGNPQRYSRVVLNNQTNYFEIERETDEGRVKQLIDDQGEFRALLNESSNVPDELLEKHGLSKERSEGYRNFYRTMYGLPMSITEEFYSEIAPAETITFEGKDAYRITMELKQEMISKNWALILSSEDHSLLALELYQPGEPEAGELITFEDEIQLGGMKLPRIRHWYDRASHEYLGSDIIVQTIE